MTTPFFPILLILMVVSCNTKSDPSQSEVPFRSVPAQKIPKSVQLFDAEMDPIPDSLAISVNESTLLGETMIHLLQRMKNSNEVYHLEESISKKLSADDGMLGGYDYRTRPREKFTTRIGKKGGPFTDEVTVGAAIESIRIALRYPRKGEDRGTLVEATFPNKKKLMSIDSMGDAATISGRPAKSFLAILTIKVFVRKPDGNYLEDWQQVTGMVAVPDDAPVAYVIRGY